MKTFANETEKIVKEGRQHDPLEEYYHWYIRETRRGREIGILVKEKKKKKRYWKEFQEKKT